MRQDADLTTAKLRLGPAPRDALRLAEGVLRTAPDHLEAQFLRAAALRRTGSPHEAREALTPMAARLPKAWGLQFELGAALAMLGETRPAIEALARASALNPASSLAWHALGDQQALIGDRAGAEAAHGRAVAGSIHDVVLVEMVRILLGGETAQAEVQLGDRFGLHLNDPLAAVLLFDAAEGAGLRREGAQLLTPHVDAAPRFAPLRLRRAVGFFRSGRIAETRLEMDAVRATAPTAPPLLALEAAVANQLGDGERAIRLHAALVKDAPDDPNRWLAYGHALKTAGRQVDSVAAYRRSLVLEPGLGEAYWSLANLKVVRFEAAEIVAMEVALSQDDLPPRQRAPLHYALGKALEDEARYEEAFDHYRSGAALVRASVTYDAAANRDYVRRSIETFTAAFFKDRETLGDRTEGPIFVVGLPRSGSTLVEQILASHPEVEGLSELPDLTSIAGELAGRRGPDVSAYPASLADLDPMTFAALGEAYLERAGPYRRENRCFFVDKFPGNFMHLGLLRLILPQARVIDVRRHPMACCFSVFKQRFAEGQSYSYDLTELGRYYTDYLALMDHFDRTTPGWVHRVCYEDLVAEPEAAIRGLLDACGLPFEAACLHFHQNPRSVRTASSEQVRRPISLEAVDHWRRFEPWLEPLAAALATPFTEPLDRPSGT